MAYIERETTIKELEKMPAYFESSDIRYGIIVAIDILKKQTPAADVVEVVRCKDCKYCEVFFPLGEKGEEVIRAHYCKLYNSNRKQIDFCSYGVKEERTDQKPVTNYDNIKAMSVQELALIIMCPAETDCCFEPPKNCAKYSNAIETDCDCCKCCEKYLESEVTE